MHEQWEQEMLFKLLLKTIYQCVLQFEMQVLQISGSSESCYFSCVMNVSGTSVPSMYFDTSLCFQASLDMSVMRAGLVCT